MELDELKSKWKELDKHVNAQDEKIRELTDLVITNKVKFPLAMLRRHCLVSVCFIPFLLPFFFWAYDFVGLNCPEWQKMLLYVLTWVFVVYCFAREVYFIFDLKDINIGRESAMEALKRIIKFRKHYNNGVLIAAVIGAVFIWVMLCSFDSVFLLGGFVGLIIGSIFANKMYKKYILAINEMEQALQEWIDEK